MAACGGQLTAAKASIGCALEQHVRCPIGRGSSPNVHDAFAALLLLPPLHLGGEGPGRSRPNQSPCLLPSHTRLEVAISVRERRKPLPGRHQACPTRRPKLSAVPAPCNEQSERSTGGWVEGRRPTVCRSCRRLSSPVPPTGAQLPVRRKACWPPVQHSEELLGGEGRQGGQAAAALCLA